MAAALVKIGALSVESVVGYVAARLATTEFKLENALATVWFAMMLFASDASVPTGEANVKV